MTEEINLDKKTLEALDRQVQSWQDSGEPLKAANVLDALTETVARAQKEASQLETDGRDREALEYYEAIAAAFRAASKMADEEERANLESITEFWGLVTESKRDAMTDRPETGPPHREISKNRDDSGVRRSPLQDTERIAASRQREYPARASSDGLTPSRWSGRERQPRGVLQQNNDRQERQLDFRRRKKTSLDREHPNHDEKDEDKTE